MPSSDYKTAVGGGLKLKGAKDAGVKKHKKRKDKSKAETKDDASSMREVTKMGLQENDDDNQHQTVDKSHEALSKENNQQEPEDVPKAISQRLSQPPHSNKTEAQIRHEETKRKRLDERVQKEGAKTHKQRVEELNKYLSRLSEHHDMPRIGPG